ncbi:MAG: hypothetical protein AAF726_04725 [Planctomycetota bacterium]
MARSSPQSFQKRQRERRKQQERAAKLERRLIRNEEKKRAKEDGDFQSTEYVDPENHEAQMDVEDLRPRSQMRDWWGEE